MNSFLITLLLALTFSILAQSCKSAAEPSPAQLKKLADNMYDTAYKIKQSLNDKELIITFDDGPISNYDACKKANLDQQPSTTTTYTVPDKPTEQFGTSDLIDYLNFHQIPATFFVVTKEFYSHHTNACTIQRIIHSPYLLAANHTWNHTSARISPQKCDNTSNIQAPEVFVPVSEHWLRLFPDDMIKQYLKNQLVQPKPLTDYSATPNTSSPSSMSQSQTTYTSTQFDSTPQPPDNITDYAAQGWSIFPTIGGDTQYVSIQPQPASAPQPLNQHPFTQPTPSSLQPTSPYPGYTNYIVNEVTAAACYLNQYILQNTPSTQAAQNYPLFYRPPGGYWELEDQDIIDHPALEAYIGPIAWHYGGNFNGRGDVADYECWGIAKKILDMPANPPRAFIKGLKAKNPLKGCADSYVAHIENQPEGQKKGIVLLHDNHPETIRMFIEYLHPQLIEKGYKIIGLDQVDYIKKQLAVIRKNPGFHKKLGSCIPARDQWCAINNKSHIYTTH